MAGQSRWQSRGPVGRKETRKSRAKRETEGKGWQERKQKETEEGN